jgi:hypothetical protein
MENDIATRIKRCLELYGHCSIDDGKEPEGYVGSTVYTNRISDSERYKDTEVTIYAIKSYGSVIYIGQSRQFNKRKMSHIFASNNDKKKSPLYEYMYNNEYEFEVIKTCLYQDRFIEENKMIEFYSKNNFLFNKK